LVLIQFALRVVSFTFGGIFHTLEFGTPLSEAEDSSILGTLAPGIVDRWIVMRVGAFETTSGIGIWRLVSGLDAVLVLDMAP